MTCSIGWRRGPGLLLTWLAAAACAAIQRPALAEEPSVASVIVPSNGTLWRVFATGKFEKVELPRGAGRPVAFAGRSAFVSPDGTHVAAVPPGEHATAFWVAGLDGTPARIVPAAAPGVRAADRGPTWIRGWSCDGRQIVYETTRRGEDQDPTQTVGYFTYDVASGAMERIEDADGFVGLLDAGAVLAVSSAAQNAPPALWRVDRKTKARRLLAELRSRNWPPFAEIGARGCGLLTVLSWHAGHDRRLDLVDTGQGTVVATRAISDRWPVVVHVTLSPSGARMAFIGRLPQGNSTYDLVVDDRSVYTLREPYVDRDEPIGYRWIDDRTIVLADGDELVVLDVERAKVKACHPDCPAARPVRPLVAREIDAILAGAGPGRSPSEARLASCWSWVTPLRTFKSDLSPFVFQDGRTGERSAALRVPLGWRMNCVDAVYVASDGRRYRLIFTQDDRDGDIRMFGGPLVAESDVRDEPPTADAFLEAARGRIADGALADAEDVIQRAVEGKTKGRRRGLLSDKVIFADSEELWSLRAAIASARSDDGLAARSREQLERLRARGIVPVRVAPPQTPQAPGGVAAGEKAYVAATRLRLRAKAAEGARILAHVPIGRAADVLEIRGGWARLRVVAAPVASDQWTMHPQGAKAATPVAPEPRELEGWAPVTLLSRRAPDRAALLAEADAAEKRSSWADAQRALERAATIAPPDRDLLGRVVRASALAGDWDSAAQWAAAAGRLVADGDGPAYAQVAARVVLGCRGDRTRAARIYPIPITDRFGCDLSVPPPGKAAGPACALTPELVAAFPADACLVGVPPPCPHCPDVIRRFVAGGSGEAVTGDANVVRLAGMFGDGPWIEAEVIVPGAPFAPDRRMFVVENRETVLETDVPWPTPGRPRTLWIPARGGGTKLKSIGFVSAATAEEARAQVRASRSARAVSAARGSLEVLHVECGCRFGPGMGPEDH